MAKCEGFKNFKERGEWVEAQFIAQALRMGFKVLKPWGDSFGRAPSCHAASDAINQIYRSQRSSRERIEDGIERSNERNRAALRRPKPASNERPVSPATSSHARGAALGNKSSSHVAVAAACELSGATASPIACV